MGKTAFARQGNSRRFTVQNLYNCVTPNKIEHRLFSFISQNWRGKPLVSHETIVNLIAATTTKTGLKVTCELDRGSYPSGIKVSKKEMREIDLRRDDFHGEWNYTISPRTRK